MAAASAPSGGANECPRPSKVGNGISDHFSGMICSDAEMAVNVHEFMISGRRRKGEMGRSSGSDKRRRRRRFGDAIERSSSNTLGSHESMCRWRTRVARRSVRLFIIHSSQSTIALAAELRTNSSSSAPSSSASEHEVLPAPLSLIDGHDNFSCSFSPSPLERLTLTRARRSDCFQSS